MLDAIAQARAGGIQVGFKASGGIRTLADAASYLALYERRFGTGSAQPAVFRIGASQLVHELLAAASADPAPGDPHTHTDGADGLIEIHRREAAAPDAAGVRPITP